MALVLHWKEVRERTPWPEEIPTDPSQLLLVQSPDGSTGVQVWWLAEEEPVGRATTDDEGSE